MITREASTRVAEYAFQYARDNGRKKVTAVHKANIMKKADGLFIECVRDVSLRYPDIMHDEMIVDNTCMQVRPHPTSPTFSSLSLDSAPAPTAVACLAALWRPHLWPDWRRLAADRSSCQTPVELDCAAIASALTAVHTGAARVRPLSTLTVLQAR